MRNIIENIGLKLNLTIFGNYDIISARNIIVFVIYTVVILIASVIIFKKRMTSDNK